ncbi:MAG: mannose-1-phosphate guanylyltransferase [Muribaculaceae bacterium]|nr:mannose-1-phosphate guanylyltransferase [Muribaculaceae bacterium]
MINIDRYCVIMCGGIGSRFWPYSRTDKPKQFIDFLGTGRSLLQMTFDRISRVVSPDNIIIVANKMYLDLIQQQLPQVRKENILLEPARRNTAPCIAWATNHIRAINPKASVIVAPSDHLVLREDAFERSIIHGFEFVESHDALLTLGIEPTRPETGYGYIQIGKEKYPGISEVKTFTEKPDLELAKVFLSSGEFFWNSGIFLWSVDTIYNALCKYAPEVMTVLDKESGVYASAKEMDFIDRNFTSCPSISIDYAVMEKADNVYVECVSFGWSDIGTWSALYDNSAQDSNRNVLQNCHGMMYRSEGNMVMTADKKVVVAVGINDYIIADAHDVLLICPKSEEQQIKHFVNDVKATLGDEYL